MKEKSSAEISETATEEEFRLVVECVRDYAIFKLNADGTIATWNPGAERLKGYKSSEIIGEHFSRFYTEKDIASRHPAMVLESALTYGSHKEEGWRVRKDGSTFWADVVITSIRDRDNHLIGFAKVTRDLTERKLFERELVKKNDELSEARDQAQTASRLKSEFAVNMSHEIRTPMNAIVGMCNVLMRTKLDTKQLEYALHIKDGANSLLTVINDILDFSKIEAGKLILNNVDFEPLKVVESVCDLLAPSARSKNLSLMAFVAPDLPKLLSGDPERLRQILINLVSNAIKFSQRGEVLVRAERPAGMANPTLIHFSVTDEGFGLSLSEQESLFQPFVQADGSISRKYGGTGLGLSISKRLVELMGGSIGVTSAPGQGSKFWFTASLPARSDQPVSERQKRLVDTRILIVEDEPSSREILRDYVSSWGMNSEEVSSSAQALTHLKIAAGTNSPFKVAIIDLVLPGENGLALARRINEDPQLSGTKLILITAVDIPGMTESATNEGFIGYLTKPVRQSQTLNILLNALTGTKTTDTRAHDMSVKMVRRPQRPEVVLIVEDYSINQQVARHYVEAMGLSCEIASNGYEAIEMTRRRDYEAILMDCQMPGMDGFSATQAIRETEKSLRRHTPIIAVTAHAIAGDRDRCLQAGMDDYISKPIDPVVLEKILDFWIPDQSTVSVIEPIHMARGQARYGRVMGHLLQMFIETAPREIESLQDAAGQRNVERIACAAHGLKGVCGTVFAHQMKITCGDLEAAALERCWEQVDLLVSRLTSELYEVSQFVTKQVQQ